MANEYSTVDCAEVHGSAREEYDRLSGGMTGTSVQLRCDWTARHDLVRDILLNRREWPAFDTGDHKPRAATASIVPEPGKYATVGQMMVYDTALITIGYSTKLTDLISEEIEPTIEFTVLDYMQFRWGTANGEPLLEAEAPGRQVRSLNLIRKYFEWEPPIPAEVLTLIGCCNNTLITSTILELPFAAETILYHPPQLSRMIKSDGSKAFNATLKFSFKPYGWNKYWRSAEQAYQSIWHVNGTEDKSYPPANLAPLFS